MKLLLIGHSRFPMPYPGTKMAKTLEKEGRVIHKDCQNIMKVMWFFNQES